MPCSLNRSHLNYKKTNEICSCAGYIGSNLKRPFRYKINELILDQSNLKKFGDPLIEPFAEQPRPLTQELSVAFFIKKLQK